jgi:hypothetical protein
MGGREALSEAQISLIKRTAAIELELEQAEGRLPTRQAATPPRRRVA